MGRLDALMIDLGLPDQPGEIVALAICKQRPGLPVIVTTGSDTVAAAPRLTASAASRGLPGKAVFHFKDLEAVTATFYPQPAEQDSAAIDTRLYSERKPFVFQSPGFRAGDISLFWEAPLSGPASTHTARQARPTATSWARLQPPDPAFERGVGVRLYSTEGEEYLDCVAGIAVNGLGHCPSASWSQALKDQADKLWHVSNIYRIPEQEALADRLCAASFADQVFFTNSGTEAVELALKLARKYHAARGAPERIDVITFDGAFHGRSYAAVNAGGNPAYLEGFGPRLPGYINLPFGDMDAVKAAVGPTTAAIMLEPVQGEGGARAFSDEDLRTFRRLCDEQGALLIYDEIQCGMGRTGKLFAYEWSNVEPDVMTVAKAIGKAASRWARGSSGDRQGGKPRMTFGTHGSTYGGNPLAMAVGLAAFDEIAKPELLEATSAPGWPAIWASSSPG